MRAKEFINRPVNELGPLGAVAGGVARGVGKAAGVVGQMGKMAAKSAVKTATGFDLDQDSLGATLAGALGFKGTADALQTAKSKEQKNSLPWDQEPPIDKQAAARNIQGKDINLPPLGQVKVNRVTPNEIELDTSKTGLGVPKIKLNSRDLQKK